MSKQNVKIELISQGMIPKPTAGKQKYLIFQL